MAEYAAEDVLEPEPGAEQPKRRANKPADKLLAMLGKANLAVDMTEEERAKIGALAIEGYKLDDGSRTEWKERNKAALDLAMLIGVEKDYPFPKAANVKYPLMTSAAVQFNARAYPQLVQGDRVAKCKINGYDGSGEKAKRGNRVSEYMSWQLVSEDAAWEDDFDRLLLVLPIVGAAFRKRYWDPTLNRQCSRLITADRLVMNYRARSIKDVPRISEEMMLYPYEIEERIRDGRFLEFEYGEAEPEEGETESDKDTPHKFIEQHRLLDLDKDGYSEPYIVTVHLETEKVCRIVPNFTRKTVRVTPEGKIAAIRKQDYYVQYTFLPSPDNGIYGMGLGWLLLATNEAINTTMNQMLDAGHLANINGGFISATTGLREKSFKLRMGEWRVVNANGPLNQALMPVTYPGPSEVLFKLLGLLIEQGKEISSIKDVMTGDTGGKVQTATTTLALIEQGMKVFSAIFKRIHRSLKAELKLQARLNEENLTAEAYNEFFDDQEQQYDPQAEFAAVANDLTPVSDPSVSTDMQRLAKASLLAEIAMGNPAVNPIEVTKRRLEAAQIEDIDKLLMPPPEPDPLMKLLGELEAQDKMAGITEKMTKALKNIADAEAAEEGQNLAGYDRVLKALQMEIGAENDAAKLAAGQPGGLPGMEGKSGGPMGAPDAQGPSLGDGAGAGGIPAQQPIDQSGGMGGGTVADGAPQGAM